MGSENQEGTPFDLERLQQLVELMAEHDLRMVKLKKGSESWILRRGPQEVVSAIPAPVYAPAAPAQASAAMAAAAVSAAAASPAAPTASPGKAIKSPTVGTYYSAPQPGDPPFVRVGDRVTADKIVCIVEAMKVFNQIPAGVSGTIASVLLNDGDAVDFGQPLFTVTD